MQQDFTDESAPSFPLWLRRWTGWGLAAFLLWGLVVVALALWGGIGSDKIGQWGDSFAPLTGIGSTLALVFVVWSSNMQLKQLATQRDELQAQREQLKLQLEELKLTREEMEAQRKEMEAQRIAQEESARAQKRANDLALMSNELGIARSRLAALRFAVDCNDGNVATVDTLDKFIRGEPVTNGLTNVHASKALRKIAAHMKQLDSLQERASPSPTTETNPESSV